MSKQLFKTDDARWQAIVSRNPSAESTFLYGVTTTGIYCRPTCPSKLPHKENVMFFDTKLDAENAGFRPCRRCHPDEDVSENPHRQIIIESCRRISEAESPPNLAQLAADAGYSPSYFHRIFKSIVGVTPKQYAEEVRAQKIRAHLQAGHNVTETIYGAGFNSSSRFYTSATKTLGMQPSTYRNGGKGMEIRHLIANCYLGRVLVAATPKGVCAVAFADSAQELEDYLHQTFPYATFLGNNPEFEGWVQEVLDYLEFPRKELDLPLDIEGTAFQHKVWDALSQIPVGSSATYRQIAEHIAQPKAVRAVARACASNAVAAVIPCHRVIRSDGGLGGYRWGLERKRLLLEREAQFYSETEQK